MKAQIDRVEFTGHLILTEKQIRIIHRVATYSWQGFSEGREEAEFREVRDELERETSKLIKRFDQIRAIETGKVVDPAVGAPAMVRAREAAG